MGLAASQTRLLTLTKRQSTIEYNAQRIENLKKQLANDSDAVYQSYMNALNQTVLKTLQTNSDGNDVWISGSLNNLMRYKASSTTSGSVFYVQSMLNGKLYVPKAVADAYNDFSVNNAEDFAEKMGVKFDTKYNLDTELQESYNNAINNHWNTICSVSDYNSYELAVNQASWLSSHSLTKEKMALFKEYLELNEQKTEEENIKAVPEDINASLNLNTNTDVTNNYNNYLYYVKLYNAIEAAGGCEEVDDTTSKNEMWVESMIKSSQVSLATWDSKSEVLTRASSSMETDLKEVANDSDVQRAESEYDVQMDLINAKDTKYDQVLDVLDTERTTIETEIESLQNVIKDNIDSRFKVFG